MAGKIPKKRFQVYLRHDQIDALRSLSNHRGISMAQLVREGIDRILEELPTEENPLLDIIVKFDSGLGDLSEKHDEFLAKTIREENLGDGRGNQPSSFQQVESSNERQATAISST
jgi:hypothetical protein